MMKNHLEAMMKNLGKQLIKKKFIYWDFDKTFFPTR